MQKEQEIPTYKFKNEVYNFCFSKCIKTLSTKTKMKQEYCFEECTRKTITAFDFLTAWN